MTKIPDDVSNLYRNWALLLNSCRAFFFIYFFLEGLLTTFLSGANPIWGSWIYFMYTWSQFSCTVAAGDWECGLLPSTPALGSATYYLSHPSYLIPLVAYPACLSLRGQAEGIASASPAVQSTLGTAGASCFKSTRSFLTERWKSKWKFIERSYPFHSIAAEG